mmetsp:Transcript_16516/g.22826  ORF Transcript_16516/g.22826 Transcript_16516/m.22826 type:complete len:177 (-) Transcript_16516:216-746(-)
MASGNSGYSQSSRKHETMRQLRTDLNLCRLPEEKMSCDRREPDDSSTYSDGGLFENRNNASGANALFDSMPYQLENMDPVPMPQGSRGIDLRDDEDGLPHKLRPHKDVGGKFQGRCAICSSKTWFFCTCTPNDAFLPVPPGTKRRRGIVKYICSPAQGEGYRDCFSKHIFWGGKHG